MVVKGIFSVQLVEALENGEGKPYKEHIHSNGKCYVETEPNADYFIRVQILNNSTADIDSRYVVTFKVDGVDLGYRSWLSTTNGSIDHGVWKRIGGQSITTALRFEELEQKANKRSTFASSSMLMGDVIVHFWEAVVEGKKKITESQGTLITAPMCQFEDEKFKKKMLRSGTGKVTKKQKLDSKYHYSYKKGKLLETVKVHYCTALGLIYAGILPKPPFWEEARLKFPMKEPNKIDPRLRKIQPTILKFDAVIQHGVKREAEEYDLFDLSQISFSDDDASDCGDNISLQSNHGTIHANSNNSSHPDSSDIRPAVVLSQSP